MSIALVFSSEDRYSYFFFFRGETAFRTARLETFRCCGHLIDHVLDRPPERFVLNELALGTQLIRTDVGADTYDFSHALIRHTLCAELWQATIGERCWSLLRVKVVSHRPTARAACSLLSAQRIISSLLGWVFQSPGRANSKRKRSNSKGGARLRSGDKSKKRQSTFTNRSAAANYCLAIFSTVISSPGITRRIPNSDGNPRLTR